MIDFSRDTTIKLKQTDIQDGEKMVGELLIDGEKLISAYREIRDCVIFTNKRVIAVNVQKLTGKKKDSYFRSKPRVYWILTASLTCGSADLDMSALNLQDTAISKKSASLSRATRCNNQLSEFSFLTNDPTPLATPPIWTSNKKGTPIWCSFFG